MPNVDNPHGLRPTMRDLFGGAVNIGTYTKPVGSGTAIFIQDAVCVSTGRQIIAGRSTAFVGIALTFGAASTATQHQVVDHPFAMFELQDNVSTANGGVTAANLGKNANLETNAGSATTLLSGHELDVSTIATTNTLDVTLMNRYEVPENKFADSNVRVECIWNRHAYNMVRTGV